VTSFAPTSLCQGENVIITGTNFTNVRSVSIGNVPVAAFTINNATTITAVVAEDAVSGQVVVDGVRSTDVLTVKFAPKPALTDQSISNAAFTNCNNSATYTLKVKNTSLTSGANNNYEINWGDGSPLFQQVDLAQGTSLTHTYNSQGYFQITLRIIPANGCTRVKTYQFYNGKNPLASLTTSTGTTGLCAPAAIEFQIGNWDLNSPGTRYVLDYGDGTTPESFAHPLSPANTIFKVSHTYNKSSCPADDFKAILQATNGCFTTTYTLNQIIVWKKPTVDFDIPATICIDQGACVTNKSINGVSFVTCNTSTDYEWNFGDGTIVNEQNPACHKYAAPGSYKITLKASSFCGTDTKSKDILILPSSPQPRATNPEYCLGAQAFPLIATGPNLKWYNAFGTLLPAAPTPATNVAGTTTYFVTQTITGQCESPRTRITVTILPLPNQPTVTTPVVLCQRQTTTPLTATGTDLKWYDANFNPLSVAPTPATTTTGSTDYYVTQTTNSCESGKAKITVNVTTIPPAPTVISPLIYCQGQISTTLTVNGTNLKWYDGNGTLLPGAPTPSTATPGTSSYSVTQSNPCGESPRATITIHVTPAPTATISYTPASLCNATVSGIVNVTQTGTPGGIYTISPNGMTIDRNTGALSPAGATPGNYTIRYTVNGTGGCNTLVVSTTVSVNSTPDASIRYPAICSADGVTPVRLSGSAGGTFSSTTGLVIDATTGAITPSASTAGTHTVTYHIAAAPPCPAFTTTTSVVITTVPNATISYTPTTLCNTTGSTPVNVIRTGTAGGNYSVSPGGLTIDPVTGTLSPAGARAGNYTISYTMVGNGGCQNVKATAIVSVNSTPNAAITYPAICTADNITNVKLSGNSGGIFSSTTGLAIDAATGAITPSTSTPGNYTVTYKIAAAPPCPEFSATTTVKITQAPAATISYTPFTLCNTPGGPKATVISTGTTGGTFTIAPAGMAINGLTGELTPADARPGTYTITYTVNGTGGCANFSTTTNVNVSATPVATIRYNVPVYCGNITLPQPVIQTGNTGGTYSAPAGLILDAVTGAITPAGSTPGNYTVTYTIAPAPPCPGYQATTNITINESPVISFPVATQAVCSGEGATFTPVSTVANTNYSWAVSGALPPNVTGANSGSFTGALGLSFINSGNNDAVITITVSPVNPVTPACPGTPAEIRLTVHPAVYAPQADDVSICMGAPAVTLQATPAANHTLKWYDAQQTLLPAAPVIYTTDSVRLQYFVSQQNRFSCEGPRTPVTAIVHPTLKITGSDFTHPTECGIPSGTIVLQTRDLNDQIVPNIPVTIYYKKFQTALVATTLTDADGKITLPLTAGSYTDIYVESTGACATAHLNAVFVLKDPDPPAKPVAGYNPPVCSGTALTLTALSATSPRTGVIEYVWAGPAFGPTPDTVTNSVITFPTTSLSDAGTYAVYAMQHNCISAADSFLVLINKSPSIPVISTRNPLCVGDELYLSATSSIADNSSLDFLWTGPGRGFPANGARVGIDRVIIGDAGRYTITVTSLESGCGATADTLIEIGDHPLVKFATDTAVYPTGFRIQLDPVITNAADQGVLPITQYTWTPTDNLHCENSLCDKPVLTVKGDACYKVKVTNSYGCSGTDETCVRAFCEHSQVFVPNAFSPDGLPDNRILMVRATGIATVKSFRIFNRWGKVMYERSNFPPNSTTYGWDGYINGRKADTGVYVYTVEVVCENGITYPIKGNVTLF
jgi:gliding motility-associated-like protein